MDGDWKATFHSLPNEILLHCLALLSNKALVTVATVSKRFYALVYRVLYTRQISVTPIPGYDVLLECYHPSARITEPSLHTVYLGTPGLEDLGNNVGPLQIGHIGSILNVYSRFKPFDPRSNESQLPPKHPAGDVPGSRTWHVTSRATASSSKDNDNGIEWRPFTQQVHLEGHELFTQLVASVSLVIHGPRRGLFTEFHVLEEDKTLRLWRDWLLSMTEGKLSEKKNVNNEHREPTRSEFLGSAENSKKAIRESARTIDGIDPRSDANIVWTSAAQNFGIRFAVRKIVRPTSQRQQMPVLMHVDEDLPVAYEIEYQELLARTSILREALDRIQPLGESYAKAVVIGSFG